MAKAVAVSAGAEEGLREREAFDPRADDYAAPPEIVPAGANLPDLRALLPATDAERSLDDWGRSERVEGLVDSTLYEFLYRYWFRCSASFLQAAL